MKNLLQQRRRTGEIGARHYRSGRKPMILAAHQRQIRTLLGKKPDLTLKELRAAVALECSLPAIHYALAKMGLTYISEQVNLFFECGACKIAVYAFAQLKRVLRASFLPAFWSHQPRARRVTFAAGSPSSL